MRDQKDKTDVSARAKRRHLSQPKVTFVRAEEEILLPQLTFVLVSILMLALQIHIVIHS